jgi:hypothetical protein
MRTFTVFLDVLSRSMIDMSILKKINVCLQSHSSHRLHQAISNSEDRTVRSKVFWSPYQWRKITELWRNYSNRLLELPQLLFFLFKITAKTNTYVKNSVIHIISEEGFIKKKQTPSGSFWMCSFFDTGSHSVKCSVNIPYPLTSSKWQNLKYLSRVPKLRMWYTVCSERHSQLKCKNSTIQENNTFVPL